MSKVKEIGFLDKGTEKHQSNVVYSAGGIAPTLTASLGVKNSLMILDLAYAMNMRTALMLTMQKEFHLNNS